MTQTPLFHERILVIDDDPHIWRAYRQALSPAALEPESASAKIREILTCGGPDEKRASFTLDFAAQGQEGYQMVAEAKKHTPYSMAFIDMRMPPGWDGMETAVKIHQLDPDIELVIVTAFSDHCMEEIVQAVGAPDKLLLLRKPFDPDEMRQIARSMTSKWLIARMEEQQRQARQRVEEQLQQANKMEAIGTLAGGIAHDFNNILSAIMGYTDLALLRIKGTNPEAEADLTQVRKASVRATDLVRQILTFSRRQTREKAPLHVALIIKEVMTLLRASIPATVDIRNDINSQAIVMADATQIHQLVMNLCTNAYHAMAERGGALTVALQDTILSEGEIWANRAPLPAGPYVTLSVRDTGNGIDPTVMANVFEPYFTTKEKGKGTGMGLAVVKGIVDGHNGAITVESVPGQGTVFTVYFPSGTQENTAKGVNETASVIPVSTNHERIMVVDDESPIRELAYQFLTTAGYRVDLYADAMEASKALARKPFAWHLLLTDLTMPGMTGEQLARKAKEIKPDLPIIICSGYIDTLTNKRMAGLTNAAYLQKPIDCDSLLAAVAKSLSVRSPVAISAASQDNQEV